MKDFINPNSRKTSFAVGEPALRNVQHGTIIQLERKGFFRVDKAFVRSGQVLLFVGARFEGRVSRDLRGVCRVI